MARETVERRRDSSVEGRPCPRRHPAPGFRVSRGGSRSAHPADPVAGTTRASNDTPSSHPTGLHPTSPNASTVARRKPGNPPLLIALISRRCRNIPSDLRGVGSGRRSVALPATHSPSPATTVAQCRAQTSRSWATRPLWRGRESHNGQGGPNFVWTKRYIMPLLDLLSLTLHPITTTLSRDPSLS